MLFHNATQIVMTGEDKLMPGTQITEEGVALIWAMYQGEAVLDLSTGAAGEKFAGFAIARNMPPQFQVKVETITIDNTGLVILDRVPVAGQLLVKVAGAAMPQVVSAAAPADNTTVSVNGAELRFHADSYGAELYVQYAYELTVAEARSITGDAPIGGLASNIEGQCAYVSLGSVSTDMIDMSEDWSAAGLHPFLSAEGRLSAGGAGVELTNLIIKKLPTSSNPYLTVKVAAA